MLVWGMEHGRDVNWEGLISDGLRHDFVQLARVTDHPAVRSPVVRGAVLGHAKQAGTGGRDGWLCQHIESGIDPEEAESRYARRSPALSQGSESPGSGSHGHSPVVLACLRHPDRVQRLAYRLARANRLEGRLTRQSAAASSAEMLYGLPLPPVRGLTPRERDFLSPLPRTLRPDQNRSLAFLREIEHDGCVIRQPPAADLHEADLCTTESFGSAFEVPIRAEPGVQQS